MAASPRAPQSAIAPLPVGLTQLPQSPATFQTKSSSIPVPPRSLSDAIAERRTLFPTRLSVPGVQPTLSKLKTPLQSIPSSTTDDSRANSTSSTTTPLTSTTPTAALANNAQPTAIACSVTPKLTIFDALDKFERKIADLIDKVALYAPGADTAKELVDVDLRLEKAVDELLLYQENKAVISRLRAESNGLDSQLNALLKVLSDARATLLSIPGANEHGLNDAHEIPKTSYTEILAYATKISKFSRAPPGFEPPPGWVSQPPSGHPKTEASADGQAPTVEETVSATLKEAYKDPSSIPANLPWPAEDEMRRGMLVQYNRMFGSDGGENGVVATEITVSVPGQEGRPDNKPPESTSSHVQINTTQPPHGKKRKHGEKRKYKQRRNALPSDIEGAEDDNSEDGDGEDEDEDSSGNEDDENLSASSDYAETQHALPHPNQSSQYGNNGAAAPATNGNIQHDREFNRETLLDLDLFEPDED
ncbi:vitamin-D-receptor interacting mediator subunit 4-domain-containing protein [Lipomyces kononenkoae]|uniref:Vitamin-D-receptor interacting mediator subunit 4-domain-containing protein n=1 Tax=Lipomyces kononenkoae TaxID=34357 RepID=A0ACC3SW48_LIPKO